MINMLFSGRAIKSTRNCFARSGFSIENLSLTGKIEGKKSRGRRRVLWMDSLKKWLEERGVEDRGLQLMEKPRNRELWNNMIAKVYRYGT